MKMNPEVKKQWVAALRSGEYLQASGVLRAGEKSFCCLGVLCDISKQGDWCPDEEHSNDLGLFCTGSDSANDLPPHAILDWAGFPESSKNHSRIPSVLIDGDENQLHDHNDSGRTFAQIADAIEEQL